MLRRKAYETLLTWKRNRDSRGLLITGARQVGKTTLIEEFAAQNYDAIVEINFYENPGAVETVSAARDAADLFMRLSVLGRTEIIPGNTLVFLDEIQECEDALTWLKFLMERTDCDYVFSGSRLGLDSFDPRSLPVGFLQTITMYPLDFEEFCWAEGIPKSALAQVRDCFEQRRPVPDYLHDLLIDTFYKYLLVGGLPHAVQVFEDTKSLPNVRTAQSQVHDLYAYDIAKYVGDKTEARQIRMVFDAIPGQLNEQNKRFKYTRLGKNLRFANLETAFDWLSHAGVALAVTRVEEPLFPLGLHEDRSSLKLYSNDVGLLSSQLAEGADLDILNKRSYINFGSIFENAAAQEFFAHGFEPRYYNTKSLGEIDFVLQRKRGGVVLCEIKSGKDYRRHFFFNDPATTEIYTFDEVLVFCDANVSRLGRVDYVPIYMLGFVEA